MKDNQLCHPKICLFGLRITVSQLFFRNSRHWRISETKAEDIGTFPFGWGMDIHKENLCKCVSLFVLEKKNYSKPQQNLINREDGEGITTAGETLPSFTVLPW